MSLLENSTAAERAAGCVWAETFKDAAAVVRNGGSISGVPTFNNGIILDGSSDYVSYNNVGRDGIYGDEWSVVFEFTPNFNFDDGLTHFFMDTTSGSEYSFRKAASGANNALGAEIGGSNVGGCGSAVYGQYWNVGQKNIFVIASSSGDTAYYLNGNDARGSADTTAWSAAAPTELYVGAISAGSTNFPGTIHSVKIFNRRLTNQEAEDYSAGGTFWNYMNEATHYWPMNFRGHDPTNAQALDIFGGNHAGWTAGATQPTKNTNFPGYGFDGGDLMTCGSAINVGTNDYTVIAMIKDAEGTGVGFDGILASAEGAGAGNLMPLFLQSGTGLMRTHIDNAAYSAGSHLISDSQWHVVGISADRSGNADFYVDGELDGSVDISAKAASDVSIATPTIGKQGATVFIVADLAHIAFWNGKALTPIQMADISQRLFNQFNNI